MEKEKYAGLGLRFKLGEFFVTPDERVIEGPSGTVTVEPKVMDVLLVLVTQAQQVVDREHIITTVWPGAVISDEALSRCIYQLRKIFKSAAGDTPYIKTVLKRGYQLTVAPETTTAESDPDVSGSRRPWVLAFGLSGLLAGALIYWFSIQPIEYVPDGRTSPVLNTATNPAIAILPFKDLSQSSEVPFLAEGLAEELMTGLGRLRRLDVVAHSSSRLAFEQEAEPQEVGEKLNVDAVLTGTIRLVGKRIRVNVRLVNTRDGTVAWTEAFDTQLDGPENLFELQDSIAASVVDVLEVELANQEESFRARRHTKQLTAHNLYLEGRYYLNRRTGGSLQQAISFFEQATDEDNQFAAAWSGLSDAYILSAQYRRIDLIEATKIAQDAVDRALSLDPDFAEAHASQGLIYLHNNRFDDSARTLRRSIALNNGYANAHNWLGRGLELSGYYAQSLESYRRGLTLDPLSSILNLNVARMLMISGQNTAADTFFEAARTYNTEFANPLWGQGYNFFLTGRLDSAEQSFRTGFEKGLRSPFGMSDFAIVLTAMGKYTEAHDWLDKSRAQAAFGQTLLPRGRLFVMEQRFSDWISYAASLREEETEASHYFFSAQAALYQGEYEKAQQWFDLGQAIDSDEQLLMRQWDTLRGGLIAMDLALNLQQLGREADATQRISKIEQLLESVKDAGAAVPPFLYSQAALKALKGEDSQALALLEQAIATGWPGADFARLDPKFQTLKDDQRFQSLMRRSNSSVAAR